MVLDMIQENPDNDKAKGTPEQMERLILHLKIIIIMIALAVITIISS
jgi:hypothetical protein